MNLWWRTTLPLWRRAWLAWRYRGNRMDAAMNRMVDHAVQRDHDRYNDNRGI